MTSTITDRTRGRATDRVGRGLARGAAPASGERHLRVIRDQGHQGLAPVPAPAPAATGPARGPVAEAPLRLTARGRAVLRAVVVIGLVLGMVLAVLVLDRPARAGTEAHPVAAVRYVVQPGDTLWDIAGRVAPEADRRDTVLRIVELNALSSSAVQAGQEIALPPR